MNNGDLREVFLDPLKFVKLCFPDVRVYDKQAEILQSVQRNRVTVVPAGNDLGKDFTAALCALWFFCSRSPCKVVTSSSGQTQLKSVLWGELGRFIRTSRYPLPISVNDLWIRQVMHDGQMEPRSYLRGIVTVEPENLQGHHLEWGPNRLPRTLAVLDEASGIDTIYDHAVDTWAHRKLIIGNPLPCSNFFKEAVKGGDVKLPGQDFYQCKVLRIRGADSPNVRLAEAEIAAGKQPSYTEMIPGVLNYEEYVRRLAMWDKIRLCIGVHGEFYEGAEVLLYPPDWLNRAEHYAQELSVQQNGSGKLRRAAKALGVDAAEGGDSTVWTVVDELGILDLVSYKTQDTADVPGQTLALMKKWNLQAENVLFDRGGGGKQHADQLRRKGYSVRTVGFGEGVYDATETKRPTKEHARDHEEQRYVFKNRRAQMYGILRMLLDPRMPLQGMDAKGWESLGLAGVRGNAKLGQGFGIPAEYSELRRQLAPLPLQYDAEGRMYLPPKNKPSPGYNGITIHDLLGRSPDEADSLVLAVFGLLHKPQRRTIGAVEVGVY